MPVRLRNVAHPDDDFYTPGAHDMPIKDRFIHLNFEERKPDRYK